MWSSGWSSPTKTGKRTSTHANTNQYPSLTAKETKKIYQTTSNHFRNNHSQTFHWSCLLITNNNVCHLCLLTSQPSLRQIKPNMKSSLSMMAAKIVRVRLHLNRLRNLTLIWLLFSILKIEEKEVQWELECVWFEEDTHWWWMRTVLLRFLSLTRFGVS